MVERLLLLTVVSPQPPSEFWFDKSQSTPREMMGACCRGSTVCRATIAVAVESALLDMKAAQDRVTVAEQAMLLAKEELTQAQDRFQAGVASNIDVVQAQESLAGATESYIASLYEHNVAKAVMGRALGIAAASYKQVLQGER